MDVSQLQPSAPHASGRAAKALASVQAVLTALLVFIVIALLLSVIGDKVLTLHRDGVYFLHEAYALKQGWLDVPAGQSFPYDLYTLWLSLGVRPGDPESLWNAVILDTGLHVVCGAALVMLACGNTRRPGWLGVLVVLAGVLFYFSVGRLGSIRPDYLAVTAMAFGAFSLVHAFDAPRRGPALRNATAAGAMLALAACFSPRSLVVLACALPLLALALGLTRQATVRRMARTAVAGGLGALLMVLLVWLVTDFSLWSSSEGLLTSRAGQESRVALLQRFIDRARPILVLMTVGVLFAAVLVTVQERCRRRCLYALAAGCFALGQIALVAYDDSIFIYGYSFTLVALLLMLVPVLEMRRPREPVAAVTGSTLVLAGLTLGLLHQATLGHASHAFGYASNPPRVSRVNDDLPIRRLLNRAMNNPWLVPKLSARIALCRRLEGYRYLSHFKDGPICLRSGFEVLGRQYGIDDVYPRPVKYPDRDQLERVHREAGLPGKKTGFLFRLDAQGRVVDALPLRQRPRAGAQ